MPSISQELESTRTARWYRAVQDGAALVANAKVTAFWPYREGVIKIADAFDMAPFEWAAAYLRALAAWASDNRSLAASHPADPPGCVAEDMEVLAASRTYRADEPAVRFRAARLAELACTMIGLVLDDAGVTPLGAFNSVRNEVHQLLTGPSTSLADLVVQSAAELSDWILLQGDREAVLTAGQAGQILGLLNGLGSLVASPGASCAEPEAESDLQPWESGLCPAKR
ncbi:MAG: hypothetical protein JWM19_1677 [Actinomycetia bacterium]|nr:hypothetical protein [Actinomycetes bacterium]